jgi:hypothetical protein
LFSPAAMVIAVKQVGPHIHDQRPVDDDIAVDGEHRDQAEPPDQAEPRAPDMVRAELAVLTA